MRARYRALAAALTDGRARRARPLRREGQRPPRGPARCSRRRAPAPTWSARANCAAPATPASRPPASCFPASASRERELRLALAEDIGQINVESAEELDMLSALAAGMGRTARVALRVNPDVDAGTHAKITTGRARDKFGIP